MAPQLDMLEPGHRPAASVRLTMLALCLCLGYVLYSVVYNLFVSPLRKVPGPKVWAVSPVPQALMQCSGTAHRQILALHQRYGRVVRTSPNAVSLLDPAAWKEVYGHRRAGVPENLKDASHFAEVSGSIIAGDTASHSRQRRILAHGFSAQGMAQQEPLIRGYIDLLFDRFAAHARRGQPVDVVRWYNYTTFDVIGDLAFGEPFGCLESSNLHPWVAIIFQGFVQRIALGQLRRAYPAVVAFVSPLLKKLMAKEMKEHTDLVEAKVAKRLALGSSRPDFVDAMISPDANGKEKMSLTEIHHNADVLTIAGSETTATTLCGVTALLSTHPDVQDKLAAEVHAAFKSEEEITLLSVQGLKYMMAVIDEAMRLYPAAAASVPRVIHKGGDTVCGHYLPEGTIVDIWHWAMYHNPENFALTESFIPERWLGDPRFANDNRDAFQPFSTGGRNCLGKNLAYAEMRLILSRLVWKYTISLADKKDEKWVYNQRMISLWEKTPLNIRLTPRKVGGSEGVGEF